MVLRSNQSLFIEFEEWLSASRKKNSENHAHGHRTLFKDTGKDRLLTTSHRYELNLKVVEVIVTQIHYGTKPSEIKMVPSQLRESWLHAKT